MIVIRFHDSVYMFSWAKSPGYVYTRVKDTYNEILILVSEQYVDIWSYVHKNTVEINADMSGL